LAQVCLKPHRKRAMCRFFVFTLLWKSFSIWAYDQAILPSAAHPSFDSDATPLLQRHLQVNQIEQVASEGLSKEAEEALRRLFLGDDLEDAPSSGEANKSAQHYKHELVQAEAGNSSSLSRLNALARTANGEANKSAQREKHVLVQAEAGNSSSLSRLNALARTANGEANKSAQREKHVLVQAEAGNSSSFSRLNALARMDVNSTTNVSAHTTANVQYAAPSSKLGQALLEWLPGQELLHWLQQKIGCHSVVHKDIDSPMPKSQITATNSGSFAETSFETNSTRGNLLEAMYNISVSEDPPTPDALLESPGLVMVLMVISFVLAPFFCCCCSEY